MQIRLFEVEPWEAVMFEPLTQAHKVAEHRGALTAANAEDYADTEILSVFIYSRLTRAVLEQLPGLKLIATRSTGYDHIDMAYCAEKGIKVANVPTYGENTVAEHVFALLLAISHHLVEAVDRTRRGDFSQAGLQGFDLEGKTMGVIGTGGIGLNTCRIAKGFAMHVLAHDLAPNEAEAKRLGFDYVSMDELLARSDIVSLHVPSSPETRHLMDRAAFQKMKTGSVLINTARGEVVDVRALLEALKDGKLRAAGLDVLPEEPTVREEAELLRVAFAKEHDLETLLADHILLRLRNVIITPHSAFNTREAVERILMTTRDNIESFLAGRPVNLVGR